MKGQIVIDEQNTVTCVCIGGKLIGGIDVDDIPPEVIACADKWIYKDGKFDENPNYADSELQTAKEIKIAESKDKLAEWLENNPILYSDSKYYSVTSEKQTLLNSNLASYERAKAAGMDYPLKWNSTGSECVAWEYSDLLALSLMIAAYVAPKVSMQQSIEIAINACESIEKLDEIVISYE